MSDSPAAGPAAPSRDQLALERTRLANERTLLAYLRTGIMLAATGGTLLTLKLESGRLTALAWPLMAAAAVVIAIGVWRYGRMARSLRG
ncbi:MAG: DUF202 domain-containing protein [Planctomycetota bacterium]